MLMTLLLSSFTLFVNQINPSLSPSCECGGGGVHYVFILTFTVLTSLSSFLFMFFCFAGWLWWGWGRGGEWDVVCVYGDLSCSFVVVFLSDYG